jgi:hypothetical protein
MNAIETSIGCQGGELTGTIDAPALALLAEQINIEHQAAERDLNAGLQHALEAGRLLMQAKGRVEHGEWLPWLSKNVTFSDRTARAYMQIATRWPDLENQNGGALPICSYREALRLVAEPAPEKSDEADHHEPDHLESFPALSPDVVISAGGDCYDLLEIYPSVSHPGYFHVAHFRDLDTDNADVVFNKRPLKLTVDLMITILHVHKFRPTTAWHSEPSNGREPWWLSGFGIPGRVH